MASIASKRLLLWLLAIIAVISIGYSPPISQDQSYHQFADTSLFWGIPNGLNVLSNAPFLFVGLYGLLILHQNRQQFADIYWSGATFSIGVFLVALGSGYYHYSPNNASLVWDRLPMTIAFMGLYAMILSRFLRPESGNRLLPWLIVVGIVSVAYWAMTESLGKGDLRWYILVQFLPMLLTLVILLFFDAAGTNKGKLVFVLVWYVLAKVFEFADLLVYEFTQYVSGHSLKHIFAAIASYYVIEWMKENIKQPPN